MTTSRTASGIPTADKDIFAFDLATGLFLPVTAADILALAGGLTLADLLATVQTGTAVMVAGQVTVGAANITASSKVIPFRDVAGGVLGTLGVDTLVVGAPGSFRVFSSNGLDTSIVRWLVIG